MGAPNPTDPDLLTKPKVEPDGVQVIATALTKLMNDVMVKNPNVQWSTLWGGIECFKQEMAYRYVTDRLRNEAESG